MRFELTEKIYMSDIEYEFFKHVTAMLERIFDHCHNPDIKDDASTQSDTERYREEEGE